MTELQYGKSPGCDEVPSRPGSAICVLCYFGQHIYPFYALGFSSFKWGVLCSSKEPVILLFYMHQAQSSWRTENPSHYVGFSSLYLVKSSENEEQE